MERTPVSSQTLSPVRRGPVRKLRSRVDAAALLVTAVLSLVSGCARFRTDAPLIPETGATDTVTLELPVLDLPTPGTPDAIPIVVDEVVPRRAAGEEDEFILPQREDLPPPRSSDTEFPSNLIRGVEDPDTRMPVKLNFDAVDLAEVVETFSILLDFDYMVDPEVKGAVNLKVDTEMSARESWELFEHILWLAGAYASRNPGFVHILPFAKMPHERRLLADHEPVANVEVAFIPIQRSTSSEMVSLLTPFVTEGATVTDLPRLNTLLVVEAPTNMPKIRELIRHLDSRGQAGWPQICMRCHNVDVELVKEELLAILPVIGLPVTEGENKGGEVRITTIPRLQVLVASAILEEVLDEIERWVRVLDEEDAAEQENIFFYNVENSTAEHLSQALDTFFNTSTTSAAPSTTKSISAKATARDSSRDSLGSSSSQVRPTSPSTSQRSGGSGTETEGRPETIFDTPLVVFADGEQNRLTIRTTPRAYTMVEALLKRLDVPSKQVAIQAYIAEITLTESTEFGFSYAVAQKYGDYDIKYGSGHANDSGFPSPVDLITAGKGNGWSALLTDTTDADRLAFIRAVAGEGNTRVLSAPQIVAASDQEAVINVGDQVPIVTGDYSSSSSSDYVRREIEYKDTGVILTVVPHITAGNQVRLELEQEVSNAVYDETQTGVASESAVISTKLLRSTLVVPDGGTVLMGGLIKTEGNTRHSGVPWLKDLPGVGWAFRTNSRSEARTELLVLISVNVIDSQSATQLLANRYREALAEIQDKMGKR
jgi:general secretion pathway protein D